ncbi:MAG: transglycosylase family protein [Geodermatophilaceae bacterium]|nr:transglycosylase family protein [Geodermatophilaceae bacterium]
MRRSFQLVLFGIVLTGLVAGSVAWASFSKTITLTIDGSASSVSTRAGSVGDVLAEADVSVGEHDTLAPSADSPVSDGGEIVLNRGRLLTLTVDGVEREIWVTARSVDEALDQLGYRQDDIYVSASRSDRLPLDGLALELRMPKQVDILVDGETLSVVTTAPDVTALLDEQDVTLAATDTMSMYGDQPLLSGMNLTITRIRFQEVQETRPIARAVVERADDSLFEGESEVVEEGVDGTEVLTIRITRTNGVESARETLSTKVTRAPVDKVVAVGTRERPPPAPAPAPAPAPPPSGGGGGGAEPPPRSTGLNWDALAQCESGGNWSINTGNGYYGGLQFDKGTWDAYGGQQYAAYPHQASKSQQIATAENLYADRGDSPWPTCGFHLYD